ncbi:MAG: hypothetical protein J3K34DRAFT_522256 [Monoraphidium minutum]|nr:MAG: hypothetical protein J3K34DRAFT_522256 [Monoraphidium minutum]
MACLRLAVLLALLVGAARAQLTLNHKVLLLTTKEHATWATGFLETIMQGYGVPFTAATVESLPAGAPALRGMLWESYGAAAAYSALVMHPDLEAGGELTKAQVLELQDFQRRTGARALKFGSDPSAAGMAAAECARGAAAAAAAGGGEAMRLTTSAPLGVSGVKADAVLSFPDIWRCPAVDGTASGRCCAKLAGGAAGPCGACTAAPVLRSAAAPPPAARRAAGRAAAPPALVNGALVNHADGRQALAFMLDCSDEAAYCMVLGHLGLAWALQNIIPGQRQVILSLQVDDVFLSTDNMRGGKYRLTPADLSTTVAWQDTINRRLPPGSNIRAELVFNGNGVLGEVESPDTVRNAPACFSTPLYAELGCSCWGKAMADCPADAHWFCRACTKDWKRVRGSAGVEYVPPPSVASWNDYTFNEYDALYRMVKGDRRIADAFFWTTHTFSHQMLDNVTFDTMKLQLDLNLKMAGDLYLGLLGRPNYSPAALVTPAISGLFNGDALAAMAAGGVSTVVGDNTWPGLLLNKGTPYHMLYTTDATNGYPAPGTGPSIAIMPRWATAMAFTASTVQEALEEWNAGAAAAERAASFDALLKAEADRVLKDGLLALRMDGHMFHQANMRVLGSGGPGSLLMMWTEAVLARLISVVSWPIRSVKLDDLSQLYVAREARDACRLSYRLTVSRATQAVTRVTAAAAGAPGGGADCAAPLTVREGVGLEAGAPGAAVRAAGVPAGDGAQTLTIRVPAGGSAALRVAGDLGWRVPPAA